MALTNKCDVDLGERSYPILIGQSLLDDLGSYLKPVMLGNSVVILTDSNVAPLYAERTEKALKREGIDILGQIVIPAGEQSKNFALYYEICEQLLSGGVERKTTILALGGGVVGDLAGFIAATVLRGIGFVQVPTSLLAQVDSSVGGKTAINCNAGKNLIGAFYQPQMVVIDTETLQTLPRRELLAGYAEVLKYGLIDDAPFFDWLVENGQELINGDVEKQAYAIEKSCAAKARVVAEDEREQGKRALLNLGHTFGHALEAEAGYDGTLLHGEAVATGMLMAFQLSEALELSPSEDTEKLYQHLVDVGLPTASGLLCAADTLYEHMTHDKKVDDGKIKFILAKGIGKSFQSGGVDRADVMPILENILTKKEKSA